MLFCVILSIGMQHFTFTMTRLMLPVNAASEVISDHSSSKHLDKHSTDKHAHLSCYDSVHSISIYLEQMVIIIVCSCGNSCKHGISTKLQQTAVTVVCACKDIEASTA